MTVPTWRRLLRVLPSFEEEMLLLHRLVAPGDVCLDVGASYGLYTVWLSRLVGERGRVHAFEPRARSRAVLQAVLRLATRRNVVVHPIALSVRDGHDVLVTPRRRWFLPVPGRTFLRRDLDRAAGYYEGWASEFGGAREYAVATRTLDGVAGELEGPVRFVKIDVEGGELAVLEGGAATIARDRPAVLCEIEHRHTRKYGHAPDDVLTWFEARDYRLTRLGRYGLEVGGDVTGGVNNYLFLPVERSLPS